jgi:hypothetical protein
VAWIPGSAAGEAFGGGPDCRRLAARRGPYLRGRHTLGRAAIAAGLGQRQQAITLLQQALTEGQEYSVRLHADLWFASLRGYPPFEELLRPKG